MSADTPEGYQPFDPAPVWLAPSPPKFQHRYRLHVVLLLLTLVTSTWAGASHYLDFTASFSGGVVPDDLTSWGLLWNGLWYSLPLLFILGAHEVGHYYYCRRHDVDATLPYFIPAPLPLTGTFGAVIRIREAFPSKRALFDIGIAGPIFGFVALIPFLYLGISMSHVVKFPEGTDVIYFGDPLLLQGLAWLHFGPLPPGHDIVLHPMGFAAWWGMLATALNLMPFGQLDGGHVVYALLGRRSSFVSLGTLAAALLLTLRSLSWISMAIMMLVMAIFLGVRHPRIVDEDTPLDAGRQLVALVALAIFIVCFTPVPIETFFSK